MANDITLGSATSTSIRYKTQRNQLASQKAGKNMEVARVYANNTYGLTDIAAQMITRGCLAKRPDIKYVLDYMSNVMQDLLIEGNRLDMGGLVTLEPVIKGTFEEGESFDINKHEIVVSATAGKVLRKVTSTSVTEKIGTSAQPVITEVHNTVSFEEDVLWGQGVTAIVKGKHLSFDETVTDEGIFISCPEYEGADLAIEIVKHSKTEISFKVNGEIDTTYTASLTFKTRQGDKNADPIEVKREVTLKPAE